MEDNPPEDKKQWTDAYFTFCKESDKESVPSSEINTDVSWKEVDWDVARTQIAKQVLEAETKLVSSEDKEIFETKAKDFWDTFYVKNKSKFFKERHYLHFQFPDLKLIEDPTTGEKQSKLEGKVFFEVGCGTGSTLFPLLQEHPKTTFYACDFAASAVNLVKSNELYKEPQCRAFVCDVSSEEFPDFIQENSVDFVSLIFVLSAIKPESMVTVLKKIHRILKPGGAVLFRDYGMYDMTQLRFIYKEGRKLDENYYVRFDKTTVFYYTLESVSKFFTDAGFITNEGLKYDTRELRNRKRMLNMYRVWVNGKFIK